MHSYIFNHNLHLEMHILQCTLLIKMAPIFLFFVFFIFFGYNLITPFIKLIVNLSLSFSLEEVKYTHW